MDLTGRRFGRLVAVSVCGRTKQGYRWLCKCDCGKDHTVVGKGLKAGDTKSCGCLAVDAATATAKHGGHGTPTYSVWKGMRTRCLDKNNPHYGGRGIRCCNRWSKFQNFLDDMGERPKGASIERINNDGDYEPSNCRWATHYEQVRNTRQNMIIEHEGKSMCVTDWEKEVGIGMHTIRWRIKNGWTPKDALTIKPDCGNHKGMRDAK